MNQTEHRHPYDAAVDKCFNTRVLEAKDWSGWGGQRNLKISIEQLDEYSEMDGCLYILPDSTMIATVVVISLRRVQPRDTDDTLLRLRLLRQLDHLALAIKHHNPLARPIVTLFTTRSVSSSIRQWYGHVLYKATKKEKMIRTNYEYLRRRHTSRRNATKSTLNFPKLHIPLISPSAIFFPNTLQPRLIRLFLQSTVGRGTRL